MQLSLIFRKLKMACSLQIATLLDEVRVLRNADRSKQLFAYVTNAVNWDTLRGLGFDSSFIYELKKRHTVFMRQLKMPRIKHKMFDIVELYDVNFKANIQVVLTENTIGFYR